jgi:hypothetical protein
MYTHDGTPFTSGRRTDGSDYANPAATVAVATTTAVPAGRVGHLAR